MMRELCKRWKEAVEGSELGPRAVQVATHRALYRPHLQQQINYIQKESYFHNLYYITDVVIKEKNCVSDKSHKTTLYILKATLLIL